MPKSYLCPKMWSNPAWVFRQDLKCEGERCAYWNEYLEQCGLITTRLKKPKTQKTISPASLARISESIAR